MIVRIKSFNQKKQHKNTNKQANRASSIECER